MSRKLKIKLKRGKAKIKLRSGDGEALLPDAQMQALLGAVLARAVPSELDRLALGHAEPEAPPRVMLEEHRGTASDAAE